MRCLADTSLENKTVALRVDLNVPVRDGSVLDDSRIIAIMPTLEYILERGGKVLLLSHFGRPTAGSFESQYSLAPIASHLSAALNLDVKLFPTIADVNFDSKVSLLENVRFLAGELENELELSKKLASLADVYIFDAFGTAHRKQASTFGAIEQSAVSCGGLLLEKEMGALNQAISSNALPSLAIVGGSKVSTKLQVLKNLVLISSSVITGGGITNTFLKAQGCDVGKSLCETSMLEEAKKLLDTGKIILPKKVIVSTGIDSTDVRECSVNEVEEHEMILDQIIDEVSLALISKAKQIIWNGPVGVFEREVYSKGTRDLAVAIAASSALSLAGGGETLLAIKLFIDSSNISYCSTGGGAFLEFMEGKELKSPCPLKQ